MNSIIPAFKEYIEHNNPVITYTPGIHLTDLPDDIQDILKFGPELVQKIKILEPSYYAGFTCKDPLNSFNISSNNYMSAFDNEVFSDYLLNYSKIK